MNTLLKKLVVRLQNTKVVVAVVSGALLILTSTGIITVDHANHVSDILNTFLTVFVGLGIFGNPESHVKPNKQELVQAVIDTLQAVSAPAPVPAPVQPQVPTPQPAVQPAPAVVPPVQPVPPQVPVQQ